MLGQLNGIRRDLHNNLFSRLDNDRDNITSFDEIKQIFNANGHPEIKSGKKTEDDVYFNFIESLEMHHYLRLG